MAVRRGVSLAGVELEVWDLVDTRLAVLGDSSLRAFNSRARERGLGLGWLGELGLV